VLSRVARDSDASAGSPSGRAAVAWGSVDGAIRACRMTGTPVRCVTRARFASAGDGDAASLAIDRKGVIGLAFDTAPFGGGIQPAFTRLAPGGDWSAPRRLGAPGAGAATIVPAASGGFLVVTASPVSARAIDGRGRFGSAQGLDAGASWDPVAASSSSSRIAIAWSSPIVRVIVDDAT
jgi:hypothetical protein